MNTLPALCVKCSSTFGEWPHGVQEDGAIGPSFHHWDDRPSRRVVPHIQVEKQNQGARPAPTPPSGGGLGANETSQHAVSKNAAAYKTLYSLEGT
jgi:hypothetical protein